MWHAGLQCIHGALLLLKGSAHEAAKQLLEGSNARDAMGTLGFSAFYMTHLLVALREAGDDEHAERVRSEVIRRIDDGHDEWALAEIRRLLALDSLKTHKDQAAALDALHGAMRIANAQGAALWRLRTAQSIGRIHIESGRTEPARDLLALAIAAMPVSDAPLPDLVHARELVSRFG